MTLEERVEDSFEQYRTKDIDYVVSPYSEDNGTKKLMFNNEYDAEEEYFRFYKQGFLAGAEEVKADELKAKNENLFERNIILLNENERLQKENAELKHNKKTVAYLADCLEEKMKERIADLEKENEELRNNGFTVSAMTEQQLKVAIEKGEQLEKELAKMTSVAEHQQDSNMERYFKLEQAKEIIADLIDLGKIWLEESDDDYEFIQKAEQFIKENE